MLDTPVAVRNVRHILSFPSYYIDKPAAVIFMVYQIGTSKKTSKFVRRLKDDPDLFPMISVFSEWEGRSTAHFRRPNNMPSNVLKVASQ